MAGEIQRRPLLEAHAVEDRLKRLQRRGTSAHLRSNALGERLDNLIAADVSREDQSNSFARIAPTPRGSGRLPSSRPPSSLASPPRRCKTHTRTPSPPSPRFASPARRDPPTQGRGSRRHLRRHAQPSLRFRHHRRRPIARRRRIIHHRRRRARQRARARRARRRSSAASTSTSPPSVVSSTSTPPTTPTTARARSRRTYRPRARIRADARGRADEDDDARERLSRVDQPSARWMRIWCTHS